MNDFPPLDDNSTAEIQTQPNSREAEEAVLGSVLIYPESYLEVAQILQQDDFYIIRNQWIWETFTRLHETRSQIDVLTVSSDLEEHNRLTEWGVNPTSFRWSTRRPLLFTLKLTPESLPKTRSAGKCWVPPMTLPN